MWLCIEGMFVRWILIWIEVMNCCSVISLFVVVYIRYCYGFIFSILVIYWVLELCSVLCICVRVDGNFNG